MAERGKFRIRPLKASDSLHIWNLFQESGWKSFGWEAWMLCHEVTSFSQWVMADETDRPVSYISIGQQSWGYFVGGYITLKKFRNQGLGSKLWQETIGKMENENIGLSSVPDMITKYSTRSAMRHISTVEIIRFKGRATCLDALKTLPKGLFNPNFKVYQIQDDRTIDKVVSYDGRIFSQAEKDKSREEFLWKWLRKGRVTTWDPSPKILSLYAENPMGQVVGYGSISPAIGAAKIAPLYADSTEIARTLMTELLKLYNSTVAPVSQLLVNVPNSKIEFIDFLHERGLARTLTMQHAYTKHVPRVEYDRIFCISSQFCQLY